MKEHLVKLVGIATLFVFLLIAMLSITRTISGVWFWLAAVISAFVGYVLLPRLRKAR